MKLMDYQQLQPDFEAAVSLMRERVSAARKARQAVTIEISVPYSVHGEFGEEDFEIMKVSVRRAKLPYEVDHG
jgi:hypothetical protein